MEGTWTLLPLLGVRIPRLLERLTVQMKGFSLRSLFRLGLLLGHGTRVAVRGFTYNTFDGEGFPACREVAAVYHPTSVDEIVAIVRNASANGVPVRASGVGHMWYDTMCSDDPNTVIVMTNGTDGISNFTMDAQAGEGSVWVEAGVTFFELADFLHANDASIGYALVNWNITIAGAVAMGAHRTSLSEEATVSGAALAMDIVLANGTVARLVKDTSSDDWLAATCSLGLLGVIARVQMRVIPEFKIQADQKILEEDEVIDGDIVGMIAPFPTANFWWWPGVRKFHYRTYTVVPTSDPQLGFQSTFSVTAVEGGAARVALNAGQFSSAINQATESLFFDIWSAPNFHTKDSNLPILFWPVTGWSQDNLIGGLYPGQQPEWDFGLHAYTLELAFPVTRANQMLRRVRELLDDSIAQGKPMTATYRSGINIKFAKALDTLLGQTTTLGNSTEDWSQGAIMLDWPAFRPELNGQRFNEPFYANLTATLLEEFPYCRPHWTKNTREVFEAAKSHFDPALLERFAAVRRRFDPNGTFKSVVGEIMGLM